MRIFILSTGRCGSTTISKACNHATNYTSSHESISKKIGIERFNYPNNHIESDNRLSWFLGQLDKKYGDDAFYLHLKRDKDKVAQSFFKRFEGKVSIIKAYSDGLKMRPNERLSDEDKLQTCYDYIETVNSNIEFFMKNKSKKMVMNLEDFEIDFPIFWKKIGAQGNLTEALNEFNTSHNAS